MGPSLIASLVAVGTFFNGAAAEGPSYISGDGVHAAGGRPPFNIPNSTWDSSTAHPNATGSAFFAAPNMSFVIPNAMTGWKWTIDVTADIPLADTTLANVNKSETFTGTQLSIFPPVSKDEMPVPQNYEWTGCLAMGMPGLTAKANDASQGAKNNCSAFISSDCLQDLSSNLHLAFESGNKSAPGCSTMGLLVPDSCQDYLDWTTIMTIPINQSTLLDGGPVLSYGDMPHAPGNLTAYDAAVEHTTLVFLDWKLEHTLDNGTATYSFPTWSLECVRADTVNAGSHVPGNLGVPARGQALSVWMAVVVTAMLFAIL